MERWFDALVELLFSRRDEGEPRVKRYKLGLLFVHGMGEQERGDTITEMGDALTEWLRRWIEEIDGADFKIREATLRTEAAASDAPSSRVSVALRDANGVTQEWLVAESWWAGAFRAATFKELVVWAASVGPWLLASQGSGILGRMWGAPLRGGLLARIGQFLLKLISTPVIVMVAALIAAVVTPAALALLLVSLIPIPVVSEMARRLAQNLAGSFGDLLVLVRSPIRFAAMAERVREDIARLDGQCERVMVVAHSQGTAVAWQAIKRASQQSPKNRPHVDLFVSFGQALRKLQSLYRVHEIGGSVQTRFAGFAFLSSALLSLMLVAGLFAVSELLVVEGAVSVAISGWDWYWSALLIGAVGVLVVQLVLQRMANANDRAAEERFIGEILAVRAAFGDFRWVDLWASADPAPNGPLLGGSWPAVKPYVASYKLRNRASTASDHSVYWSNVTEFVSAIAHMASALAWPNATGVRSLSGLREAICVRDWRVNMLAVARVAFVVGVGFALVGVRESLAGWGGWIREWIGELPVVPDEWFAGWLPLIEGLLAAALIGLGALVIWLILVASWAGPIRGDERAFFKRRPQRRLSIPATLWFATALAIPVSAVIAVSVIGDELVLAVSYAIATTVAALAVVTVLSAGGKRLYEAPEP